MDPNRRLWNDRHQKLTRSLATGDRETAIQLFLDQHAMVHTARVSKSKLWSFEDEVLNDMTEEEVRQIPRDGEHSIAWILLHLSRIEDIVMNILVAGTEQLFTRDDWARQMNVNILHSTNKMNNRGVAALSTNINIEALRKYRLAVARRTRQISKNLQAWDFKQKVDPCRIENVLRLGAVTPEAMEIINYWSKKTIAGLLLMPPTRHCILHWNEALRIKGRIRKGNHS